MRRAAHLLLALLLLLLLVPCAPAGAQNGGGGSGSLGLSTIEAAVRQGSAFNASATCTSVVATYCPVAASPPVVPSGYALSVVFTNPVGSGYRCVIYERRIDANVQAAGLPLQYNGLVMPAALASPIVTTNGTSILYSPAASACNFSATVTVNAGASVSAPGLPTLSGYLPTGGLPYRLMQIRVINPGQSIGNVIYGGLSSILGSVTPVNASANVTYYWTQERCLPSGC